LVKGQTVDRLARAIGDLPAPQRTVVELVYWQELDIPSVARQMRLPLNTTYSHLHRARLALRAVLHEETEHTAPERL
jgi:DNA-directed RNA polymerase specialized sigma24 family protein